MRRVGKMIGRTATAVAVALAVAAVGFFLVVPRFLGGTTLAVLSGSMSPAIPTGSVVLIRPVEDLLSVEPGTVITYQVSPTERALVTHRVVRFQPDTAPPTYVTKGDANDAADTEPVPVGAIRGEVVAHLPYLGHIARVLGGARGASLLGTLVGLVFITYHVRRIVVALRDDRSGSSSSERDDATEPCACRGPGGASLAGDTSLEDLATVAHTDVPGTTHQLLVARFPVEATERGSIGEVLDRMGSRVSPAGTGHVAVSVSGTPAKLDHVERLCRQHGATEVLRTSTVVLAADPLAPATPACTSPSEDGSPRLLLDEKRESMPGRGRDARTNAPTPLVTTGSASR